ncbi:MAG: TolB amino-terminal protein, partial [Lacunisphaera sp.]|nr:TolB amino-terminal protein [Lacunisphaera sp.]
MSEPTKAVFLSYASQDAEAAKRICDALRAAGVEVWFDQSELVGGDSWDAKIRGQISSCGLFVPLISANTQARLEGYFRLEWKLAAQRTHTMADEKAFLLPILLDGTRDADAKVPGEFKTVQWTKLPGGETPPAFAARVMKLLEGEVGASFDDARGRRQAAPLHPVHGTAPSRPSKWWWGLPIFGVTMALLLVLKEGRRDLPPPASPPVLETASSEISRIRASLRPDEWTRADFDALVPTIDRMIQANPENGEAWALRGVANSLLVIRNLESGTKPLEVGKEAADRALRLAPKSPLAELALGLHLSAMISRGSDVHAPRLHIERGLAGLPATEALSRYADVTSYWLGYQLDGADKTARAWLAAEPGASFPAWILAQSALASRRPAETIKWAEQAAIDPDITGIRAFVTLFEARYYLQADVAAARAALDRVPGGQRGVHRVVAARFLVAMAEKHFDQALQELAQTPAAMLRDRVFHGPKALLAGFAHQAAGRAEVALGFFRDSEKLLREELARDQDNFELRAVLALNLACLGRADEARRELAAVEPLLAGREPSVYTRQPLALITQAHGVMGEIDLMVPWLRRLITEPSGMPFTPASLRLDSRFGPYTADPRLQVLLTEFAGLDQPATVKTAELDQRAEASVPTDQKSVAVLAFANLSDDKANEYFSDGISEELLNVLAKIPGLKVSARTSAFYFKGKEVPVPEIARQLGVAYVVEGSVRKQGDKVRITAQLIKADG